MSTRSFLDGRVTLHGGDCLDVLAALPEASVDSVVCDPPYHLVSIVKRFGAKNAAKAKVGKTGAYARASAGFMGKQWDGGDIAFRVELWTQVLRVLKPGGHLLAFSGTRTYHRMACAIEDAGFEIRDQLGYCFGSGFPKSHNVSRNLGDARCSCQGQAGSISDLQRDVRSVRPSDVSSAEHNEDQRGQVLQSGLSEPSASPSVLQRPAAAKRRGQSGVEGRRDVSQAARQLRERSICEMPARTDLDGAQGRLRDGAPSRDGEVDRETVDADGMRASHRPQAAEQCAGEFGALAGQPHAQAGGTWPRCERCGKPVIPDGLGSALKPAWEPICLARKPLIGTLVENVLTHGVGALNIDGCRVGTAETLGRLNHTTSKFIDSANGSREAHARTILVDNSGDKGRWPANIIHDGSEEVLAAFPDSDGQQGYVGPEQGDRLSRGIYGDFGARPPNPPRGDSGSAARFFYTAKADAEDRLGSKHPTVKPLDLMQWLVRLVTPKGGTVLDPFAGTGTTGEAAWREGMNAVLIEREPEYQDDIARRMDLATKPTKRAAVAASKNNLEDPASLPLFAGENL